MNTSVEKNNPEVLSGNKTGGIHSHKSLISTSNQKKKKTEKTQHSTKQNKTKQEQKLAITKMRSAFKAERNFVILDFFQATFTFINKVWVKNYWYCLLIP